MRTVKVEMLVHSSEKAGVDFKYTTEVVLDHDSDPEEAGYEAGQFLMGVGTGFGRFASENSDGKSS